MRAGLTLIVGAVALSGCIGQPLTIGGPVSMQDAARQTCLANFGLTGAVGEVLTADQTLQLNGCIAQSLAGTIAASGGLVPLTPIDPVPVSVAVPDAAVRVVELRDNPNFRAASATCLPGSGVLQGGTNYCTGGVR